MSITPKYDNFLSFFNNIIFRTIYYIQMLETPNLDGLSHLANSVVVA